MNAAHLLPVDEPDPFEAIGKDRPLPSPRPTPEGGKRRFKGGFVEDVMKLQALGDPELNTKLLGPQTKKQAKLNPRTIDELAKAGYVAEVVEYFDGHSNRKHDLYGCIDIIAARPSEILAVQVTTLDHVQARLKKAKQSKGLRAWLQGGGKFEVWGWHQRRGEGTLWECRWFALTLADFPEEVNDVPSLWQ